MDSYNELDKDHFLLTSSEVGEGGSPSKALLFKNGSVTLISGKSSSLAKNGFKPFEDSNFNTQFALTITQALANFHGILRAKGLKRIDGDVTVSQRKEITDDKDYVNRYQRQNSELTVNEYMINSTAPEVDIWTSQISRHSLISSNLCLMCSHFQQENVSSRIINKLESLQSDIETFSKFIQFASAMQMENQIQSVGPISMCDIWVPISTIEEDEYNTIVIRLRGGPDLQGPPMRDITWVWLTLLRPEILHERYMELCESYYTAFNNTIKRHHATKIIEELTLFDIMKDLGDSFLHAFLTIVHKFTLSGVWCLDRRLHTSEGIHSIADSLGFLIDNGIIGSLLIV